MLEKLIFLLLGTVAAHIKVCPVHTSVLYDLSYQCDAHHSLLENRKTNLPAALEEIRQLKARGGCAMLNTFTMLSTNPTETDYSMPVSPPWGDYNPGMASTESYSYDGEDLHVMFYIDTQWDSGVASFDFDWMALKIIQEVENSVYPSGTTFEVFIAAPGNVYAHYPVYRPDNTDRKRRTTDSVYHDCEIRGTQALYQRLAAALRVGPIATELVQAAGLKSMGLVNLSSYYLKYVKTAQRNRIISINIINHDSFVSTISDTDKWRFFSEISHVESTKSICSLFLFREQSTFDNFYNIMDVATYDGADVGFGLIGGYWRFELQYLINYWYGFTPAPTAAPTIVVPSVNPVTDDACACQNGCTCEPSCKDENNYYCKPQVGFPFIGKNCEYPIQPRCTTDSVSISVPNDAIFWYAQGVPNVAVHGCVAGTICHPSDAICGPFRVSPGSNSVVASCPVYPSLAGGSLRSSVTFVLDRVDDLISMPRALTRVDCIVEVRQAQAVIRPEIRNVGSLSRVNVWQPTMSFWKTNFNIRPGIPANNLAVPGTGTIIYVVGEMLHVRLEADYNGSPASQLPTPHTMSLDDCTLRSSVNVGQAITILSNGVVPPNLSFPVVVDRAAGSVGGGQEFPGVGFQFQMFQFAPGTEITLTCSVRMDKTLRRRRSVEPDWIHEDMTFSEFTQKMEEEFMDEYTYEDYLYDDNIENDEEEEQVEVRFYIVEESTDIEAIIDDLIEDLQTLTIYADLPTTTTTTTTTTRTTVNLGEELHELFNMASTPRPTVNLGEQLDELFHMEATETTRTTINLADELSDFFVNGTSSLDAAGKNLKSGFMDEVEDVETILESTGTIWIQYLLISLIGAFMILVIVFLRQRREMIIQKRLEEEALIGEDKSAFGDTF